MTLRAWNGSGALASPRTVTRRIVRSASVSGASIASRIGPHAKPRATVFGIVERGGRVVAMHVESRYGYTLRSNLRKRVEPGSIVYTDDYAGYSGVEREYTHHRINHTGRIYAEGHVHTQ